MQLFLWFTRQCKSVCCIIQSPLSAVTFQGTKNCHHKSWYLHMGEHSPVRTLYDKALDQCNSLNHSCFLHWMKVLPRAMHLFRQSSKTKFYTNPDVKWICKIQGFYHHRTFLKPYVPQDLLYERCSNLNCWTIPYNYAFPDFICHTYIFPGKKKYSLTQNCPRHDRWLQKTISRYYYVSDFIQLLSRKIIRAAFRDASFSYSLLSSDYTHF